MARSTVKKGTKTTAIKDIPMQTVNASIDARLPNAKLSTMLSALENNVSNEATIIHITSAYQSEGVERIALEAALFAATQEEENVLFIDVTPRDSGLASESGLNPAISLDQFVLDGVSDQAPFLHVQDTSLVFTKLTAREHSGNLLFNTRQLKELLTQLKSAYDLIIINSEDSIKTGAASALASLVDNSVIVIEANRTRMPVIEELVDTITNSGGKIAGTVMSGRQYYIPKWVYKLFFNTETRD